MRRDHSILILALLVPLPLTGCSRQPPSVSVPTPAGHTVSVVKPEMRPITRLIEQPGTVQAFEETALCARLSGYVGKIEEDPDKLERIAKNTAKKEWPEHDRFFDIGSRVAKGRVLAELMVPELNKQWEQKVALVRQAGSEILQAEKSQAAAKAGVAASEASVTEAESGVDRTQALVERTQKEVSRVTKQVASGVDTGQALDEAQLQFKAAEAAKREATAKVASAKAAVRKAEADEAKAAADVDAAKSRLDVAKAEVGRIEALLEYTRIKAPFDGVVTHRSLNTGDIVADSDKVALFRVARIDPVRVIVQVPEADAGLVATGQDVAITVQGGTGLTTGKVRRTSWSLEPGSRTLRTEIDLPNEKGLVRPGTYVYAKLMAELPAAWSVPVAAVMKVGDDSVLHLVENGKAVRVTVQLLRGDAKFTQVKAYKKGGTSDWVEFKGGESIATPAAAIKDGQPIP